jgi:hypothetical protein
MLVHADVSFAVIGAAIEVHKQLGPGLLERPMSTAYAMSLLCRKFHSNDRCHSRFGIKAYCSTVATDLISLSIVPYSSS